MVQNDVIIICNYHMTCNGKCEKCRYLTELKIITLEELNKMELKEPIPTCDCG